MSDDSTPARADVGPGDKVAGYRLEEQIGQGGMAVVYRAYDERLDRRVALKLLAPALAADTAFRARFLRESRAAAAVDHPNIIPVYDAGDAGSSLFISMRYVQGGDVRSLLAGGQALPPARAWNIISQVASALDAAHAHDLVHRDVKPANMLLDRSGKDTGTGGEVTGQSKEHVYLSDFGISKQTVASQLTSTGQFLGTLDYIAPEQIEGQGIDGRADQYSLACAAYELLSGAPPFPRANGFALINSHLSETPPPITTLRSELPPAVDRVLGKAMDKSPARRYPTCEQFATDLGRALGLVPGAVEAGGLTADLAGGAPGKPWPATELATPGAVLAAQGPGQPGTPAAAMTVQPPVAGAQGAAADPATMAAGQQGWPAPQQMQAGPWPAGQPGPYPQQTYPQAGGPGAPGWPQYPAPQPPRRSRGMIAGLAIGGAAVIVAAAVVGVTLLNRGSSGGPTGQSSSPASSSPSSSQSSSPSASPSTGLTGQSEATAVSNLLVSSMQTRQLLLAGNGLVNDVGNCVNPGYDVSQARQIRDQRQSEYNQAQALQTNLLSNGTALKSELVRALRYSLEFDQDLFLWARQQRSSGCTVGTGSQYYPPLQAGSTLNNDATFAKQQFLTSWNRVATQFGLAKYSVANPPI